jgi:hypothetical protein
MTVNVTTVRMVIPRRQYLSCPIDLVVLFRLKRFLPKSKHDKKTALTNPTPGCAALDNSYNIRSKTLFPFSPGPVELAARSGLVDRNDEKLLE